ncbi:hypothetical protein [Pedobacter sp. V48]|uniref:hypothetical protein n=1 Tax=Pedobacter sp. V48 TaxID=509635 RepID=UPI0003E51E54|nr:hypothetical protein [Pedobacter sp. V48]ETZ20155.1 hypothetical protein N824_08050 [Pedobacter sp. V48]
MNNLKSMKDQQLNAVLLSWLAKLLFVGVVLALALIIFLQSCSKSNSFAGTYVNTAGSEFSIAHDTLVVEHVAAKVYLIHRSTGFQLLDEAGQPGKKQLETEEWTADYDADSGIMMERRRGKTISFNADATEMTVVRRKYRRIN